MSLIEIFHASENVGVTIHFERNLKLTHLYGCRQLICYDCVSPIDLYQLLVTDVINLSVSIVYYWCHQLICDNSILFLDLTTSYLSWRFQLICYCDLLQMLVCTLTNVSVNSYKCWCEYLTNTSVISYKCFCDLLQMLVWNLTNVIVISYKC